MNRLQMETEIGPLGDVGVGRCDKLLHTQWCQYEAGFVNSATEYAKDLVQGVVCVANYEKVHVDHIC
jgi:hypothetical protein